MEKPKGTSTENQLPDGDSLVSLAYQNAPDPMFLLRVDPNGHYRCHSVNRAYLNRLGLTEAEVVGKRIEEVLPESEASVALAKSREAIQVRRPVRYEVGVNGSSIAQTTLAPILDEAGRCVYVLGVNRDVTEFKRAEFAERERRLFAETLRDLAAMINSTLDLDHVLDQILINVGQVAAHDAANIMLLDFDGSVRIVRGRGYEFAGKFADTRRVSIETLPLYRRMIETKSPAVIADVRASADWQPLLPNTEWVRAYTGALLRLNGRVIGFLNLESATPDRFTPADAERLQAFADQMAVAVENARLHAQVRELAIVDELTGVYNRRGLFQFGEYEVNRALRFKRPLSAIMLDIDLFKRVNDTHGHAAGDIVLRQVAQCCRENLRAMDIVARYGGEEFVVLLPETDTVLAEKVAERLRQSIAETAFHIAVPERACNLRITASLGVAGMQSDMRRLTTLIERADHAQYLAKNAGGNLVVVN
jgi:diguanylate cyclase (GGDEF)-like protein/PAS domain S-box-containing protein